MIYSATENLDNVTRLVAIDNVTRLVAIEKVTRLVAICCSTMKRVFMQRQTSLTAIEFTLC